MLCEDFENYYKRAPRSTNQKFRYDRESFFLWALRELDMTAPGDERLERDYIRPGLKLLEFRKEMKALSQQWVKKHGLER